MADTPVDVVEVIRALLPLGTAVLGFLGGLLAVSLTEKHRRARDASERRRNSLAALVHELAESAKLPNSVSVGVANEQMLQIIEASIVYMLDLPPNDAVPFNDWFSSRTRRLVDGLHRRNDPVGFEAYSDEVDEIFDWLLMYHRGSISMRKIRDKERLSVPATNVPTGTS